MYRLEGAINHVTVSHWLLEHLGIPLVRALLVVVFMLIAYPTLYAVDFLPPVSQILCSETN